MMLSAIGAGKYAPTPLYDDFAASSLDTSKWATYVNQGNPVPYNDSGQCVCAVPVGGNGYACAIRALTPIPTTGNVAVKWRQTPGGHYLGGYGRPRVTITRTAAIYRNSYYKFPASVVGHGLALQFGGSSASAEDATHRGRIGAGQIDNGGVPYHDSTVGFMVEAAFPINVPYDFEWLLDFNTKKFTLILNGEVLCSGQGWGTFTPTSDPYYLEFGNYQYGGAAYTERFDNISFTGAS